MIFTVLQPAKPLSMPATSLTGTFGIVALIGIRSLPPFGVLIVADSIAALSQVAASLFLYSMKGANSLHPAGPSNTATSRIFKPRKLDLTGNATT